MLRVCWESFALLPSLHDTNMYGAQFLACLLIFTFANVVATLLSKALASHFHKSTHFDKMQQAIRNVRPWPGSLCRSKR